MYGVNQIFIDLLLKAGTTECCKQCDSTCKASDACAQCGRSTAWCPARLLTPKGTKGKHILNKETRKCKIE